MHILDLVINDESGLFAHTYMTVVPFKLLSFLYFAIHIHPFTVSRRFPVEMEHCVTLDEFF